jgi:hypothetical protein
MANQTLLLSMVKNQFEFLEEPGDKDNSTNSPVRKAEKKLREINKLKKKKNLTKEELEKIMQEDEWLAIVNSEYEVTSENPQDLLLRKDKQHQKQQQTLDRKLKAQEKQIKRLHQENQKLKQEKQELKQEKQELNNVNIEKDNLINRLLYELNEANKRNMASSSNIEKIIQKDFKKKCDTNPQDNPVKTWRKWMINYHPDKLSKVLGTSVANEMAKIATELKP